MCAITATSCIYGSRPAAPNPLQHHKVLTTLSQVSINTTTGVTGGYRLPCWAALVACWPALQRLSSSGLQQDTRQQSTTPGQHCYSCPMLAWGTRLTVCRQGPCLITGSKRSRGKAPWLQNPRAWQALCYSCCREQHHGPHYLKWRRSPLTGQAAAGTAHTSSRA